MSYRALNPQELTPIAAFTTADMLSWYPGLMSIFLWISDVRGYAKAHVAGLIALLTSVTGGLDSHASITQIVLTAIASYAAAGTFVAATRNKDTSA